MRLCGYKIAQFRIAPLPDAKDKQKAIRNLCINRIYRNIARVFVDLPTYHKHCLFPLFPAAFGNILRIVVPHCPNNPIHPRFGGQKAQ
jgi:hypothetical protein